MIAPAVLGWRLGLGWLLGRRWLLLTTTTTQDGTRHSLHAFRFYSGTLYVPRDGGAWENDLVAASRALAQTHPGPLAVRTRPPIEAEVVVLGSSDWVALEPTAEPTVGMVEPDLMWVWPMVAALIAAGLVVAARRRDR